MRADMRQGGMGDPTVHPHRQALRAEGGRWDRAEERVRTVCLNLSVQEEVSSSGESGRAGTGSKKGPGGW